jgi:hypothetical protein
VRLIANYHGGTVRAVNLADGSGVAVMVDLPLAVEETALAPTSETLRRAAVSYGEPAIHANR